MIKTFLFWLRLLHWILSAGLALIWSSICILELLDPGDPDADQ